MTHGLMQSGKFLAVGTLNTAIDFGTLNLLSWLTGIYGGVRLSPLNVPGMLWALTNSYLLNKHWTFKTPVDPGRRVGCFVLVSLVGVGLNTALVVALTHVVTRPLGLPPQLWENKPRQSFRYAGGELTRPCLVEISLMSPQGRTAAE
jgi:putative flippase GtrA